MKICIVNSFYYPQIIGGAEVNVLNIAELLHFKGHEVHILCIGEEAKSELINGIFVHRIKIRNLYSPVQILNEYNSLSKIKRKVHVVLENYNVLNWNILKKEIESINPDILHLNNIFGISRVIWSVANYLNIPVVQTLHDYGLLNITDGNIRNKIKKVVINYLSRNIKIITAPSNFTLGVAQENNYFNKANKIVVYNGINFDKNEVNNNLFNKKNLINKKEKIKFVFLGRLEKEKGVEKLINAFKKIDNNGIELIIAGKGRCTNQIIKESKLDTRINYVGFLNEKERDDLFLQSDVLIIPSIWPEPFGIVSIEAFKFAMPVIGTKSGGIPEVISNNFTGKLINSGDEIELIDAINYFIDKKNIYNMLDNCAKEVEKFDINKQVDQFIEIYSSLIY